MATNASETDLRDKSAAELLRDLSTQMTTLVHQEVNLAKAEISEKTKRMGIGAGFFGAAGIVALFGVGALVAAAIAGLATVVSLWLSALIVGGALVVVAGAFALGGKTEVSRATPPVPQEALASTKEDVAWLKTQAKSAKP